MNRRCTETLDVLKEALLVAKEWGVEHTIVLGDLFDNVKPAPQLISRVQDCFRNREVSILLGNHDRVSSNYNDHAIGPLREHAKVFDKTARFHVSESEFLYMVPFQPGPASEWLGKELELLNLHSPMLADSKCVGMCLHLGIRSPDISKSRPWLADSHDAIDLAVLLAICDRFDIPNVWAGNWHKYRSWRSKSPSVQIYQVGALVPTGWDNPGMEGYGSLILYDNEKEGEFCHRVEIEGPRFLNLPKEIDLEEWTHNFQEKHNLIYARVPVHPACFRLFRELSAELESHAPWLAHLDPVVDDEEAKAHVRVAANAARSQDTLDESVYAYFEELQLENKAGVLRRVLGYLGI